MKKVFKIFVSIFAVFILAVLTVFGINATDEKQTELTQQMLQKFPAQDGFALKDFKFPKEERLPSLQFQDYSEYLKSPEKFDELISKYQKNLATIERAFKTGKVAINPDDTFYDGVYHYSPNDHKLFLISLSQKIKKGLIKDALNSLAESNRFLVNLTDSPQTFISELIALSLLRANADFVKNLKTEGILKETPATLKDSFYLTATPEKMWELCSRREFQLVSTVVLGPLDSKMFDMTSVFTEETDIKRHALGEIAGWFFPKLIRRNQTLNSMSESFAVAGSAACDTPSSKECRETDERATTFTAFNFFINPAGRTLNKLLIPRFGSQVRLKLKASTEKLNKTIAEI